MTDNIYSNKLLIQYINGPFVLGVLTTFMFCKWIAHAFLSDGGLQRYSNVDPEKGNVQGLLLVMWMFGNTQFGVMLHDLLALCSGEYNRIRQAISIHNTICFFQLIMVHFLWNYVKLYPLPANFFNPKPGLWLHHFEFFLTSFYLIVSSNTNFFIEKVKTE